MKLFCAIVGKAGSVFSVRVDESDAVDDIKKAIKAEKSNDFKHIDADKLRLFLAKAIQNIDSRLIISMRRNCDHTLVFLHVIHLGMSPRLLITSS